MDKKSNNWVLVGIWVIICIQKPSHHFLQTFCPVRMFKIVSLFCLLRLISASAARIAYITSFCSMMELLHELINNSC